MTKQIFVYPYEIVPSDSKLPPILLSFRTYIAYNLLRGAEEILQILQHLLFSSSEVEFTAHCSLTLITFSAQNNGYENF